MNQPILLYRSGSVYANETAAWAALDAVTHKKGQPIVAFYTLSSPVSGHHGSSTIGAIFAIGIGDGVGQYKACTSHDDMLIVAQSLNAHITQFNQMFEYDANHNAIKAKLDFYTTDGKSISAGGIGSGSSASLGALYQLVDVMANSSYTGVEGAVEGSVLAYDATAGKWKAIAQSDILPDMSGYYTKDETDSAINTAKSNLQGQVDTLQALIPATASADNQLADKDFVNSSIATATAEFRGSFTSLDELKATSGNLNDYAFYLHTDSVGNSIVDRYKWTTAGWLYEYTLNNSSFTAEQWAALNSTITATLVQSYNSHLDNSTIHITAEERSAWNNKWDYNEETIKTVKVNAAGSADYASSAGNADTLDGYHSSHFLYSPSPRDFADGTFIQTDITFVDGTIFYVEICSNGYGTGIINSRFQGYMYQASLVSCDSTHLGTSRIAGFVAMNYNDKLAFWFPRQGYWCGYRVFVSDVSDSATQYNRVISVTNSAKPSNSYEYTFSDGAINAFITSNVASATKLATARKIWGKPFDGSGDISGDLTEVGNITASGKATIQGDIISGGEVVAVAGEGTPAGVTDYSALTGKPAINGVTLVSGNNTLASLGIQAAGDYATNSGVTNLLANYADKTFVSNNYVGKSAFNNHTADTDIHITSTERTAWNSKWDYNEATIKAVKVTSASSADSVAWSGISGKPTTFTPSAHTHTASEISGLPTNLSAFTNDVGYITGITKSMVEGVLTGDIASHTHTFASLTSKPTTIAGYGITDALVKKNANANAMFFKDLRYNIGFYDLGDFQSGGYRDDYPSLYGSYISITDRDNDISAQMAFDSPMSNTASDVFYRIRGAGHWNTAFTSWKKFITEVNINSYAPTLTGTGASGTWGIDISGNASSATKLATARKIWGQSFDGTGNVDGYMLMSGLDVLHIDESSLWLNYGAADSGKSLRLCGNDVAIYYGKSSNFVRAMTINSSGNVGIGTTTDNGYKLDVNGKGHYSGDLIVDGEVSALVA